jgi:hypothetical protein
MKIIPINIPEINNHRHYCLEFQNSFIKHQDPINVKGIGYGWVQAWGEGNEIELEKKDNEKMGRYDLVFKKEEQIKQFDYHIDGSVFLLYDNAGLNYAHFFFDCFGRCLYFDELLKINPKIKLAIPEDFYMETGNSTFIKQWIDLYYNDRDIDILILEKNKMYSVDNLYISNILYGFPEPVGHNYIANKIVETASKIPPIKVKTNGCYISRQDTIKRGWYHKRDLINEIELIEKIRLNLNYDIIELMDYDIIGKIQIFKSYKNIIQQNSASNVNILFSTKDNTNIIIENPRLGHWMNPKLQQFSVNSNTSLVVLEGAGEYLSNELDPNQTDKGNYPWKLNDIDGIIDVLKQVDNDIIW